MIGRPGTEWRRRDGFAELVIQNDFDGRVRFIVDGHAATVAASARAELAAFIKGDG